MAQSNDEKALFYMGRYYALDNFSAFAVELGGMLYPTAEHAYQASKFRDGVVRGIIQALRSAHEAKKMARRITEESPEYMRCGWGPEAKLEVMENILRAKLHQHPYVQKTLLRTGGMEIVEDSPKDSFWGRGPDWNGENHLGKLWMKLREDFIKEQGRGRFGGERTDDYTQGI